MGLALRSRRGSAKSWAQQGRTDSEETMGLGRVVERGWGVGEVGGGWPVGYGWGRERERIRR